MQNRLSLLNRLPILSNNQTTVPASGKRLTLRDDVRCELGPGLLKDFKFDLTANVFHASLGLRAGKSRLKFAMDAAFPTKFESHLGHTIVWQKFLARVRKAAQDAA